jgi:transposase InsO family protein
MKYRFIHSCADQLPVERLCSHLGVARSGYYKWLKHTPGQREQEDVQLAEVIETEFWKHRGAYGSPRMCDRLRQLGRRHGRRRVRRLMVDRGLIARKTRRFVTTTKADPSKQPAPNVLNREFSADGPNRKWVSDITVIPTAEGDLYLASTLDLWSRMIVGWAIRETMEEDLVHQAFDMAVQRRWPDPGLLHHSDQGSQYTANGFRQRLRNGQCIESNSRKGNVWDNAVKESFFSSLEMELLRKKTFSTKAEAIQEVFIYIEIFYNRQRIHSSLGGRSPAEFEAAGGN